MLSVIIHSNQPNLNRLNMKKIANKLNRIIGQMQGRPKSFFAFVRVVEQAAI
jgi:hypothetical protein